MKRQNLLFILSNFIDFSNVLTIILSRQGAEWIGILDPFFPVNEEVSFSWKQSWTKGNFLLNKLLTNACKLCCHFFQSVGFLISLSRTKIFFQIIIDFALNPIWRPLIEQMKDYKWIHFFLFSPHWRLGIDSFSMGPILEFITTLVILVAR